VSPFTNAGLLSTTQVNNENVENRILVFPVGENQGENESSSKNTAPSSEGKIEKDRNIGIGSKAKKRVFQSASLSLKTSTRFSSQKPGRTFGTPSSAQDAKGTSRKKQSGSFNFQKKGNLPRLSKSAFLKIQKIKKRLKKRLFIRNRYTQLLSKGLFIRKNGSQILRKVRLKGFIKKLKATKTGKGLLRGSLQTTTKVSLKNKGAAPALSPFGGVPTLISKLSNKLSKKFATLFIQKVNKKFLISLKTLMKYWHKQTENQNTLSSTAPTALNVRGLSYNPKLAWHPRTWRSVPELSQLSLTRSTDLSVNTFSKKPISKLIQFIDILEKKSLKKMELLRKDFIGFGRISKTRSFGYYQIITLLKNLKELVNKLKKQTLLGGKKKLTALYATKNENKKFAKVNLQKSLTQNVFNTISLLPSGTGRDENAFVSTLKESRKLKFINYLQNIVKTHRNENIFYYLSSMALANKGLKELKRYTQIHSNFLFGFDINSENKQTLQEKIEKVLAQSNKKMDFEKNLQDTFLEQVENQRKMHKANLALTPKISIKFFAVKPENVFEKASIVADSVVDALEKRKAFRGVIKKAKEDLMRCPRVKGVKIQVAGRLNGAEIARSEWVRAGRVPLQTLRANIDYSSRTASTIYGIIGVKVWLFKGYN
jgi:ribosomal protein S3